MSLRTQVRHYRVCCLRLEFTRTKTDVALLGSAKLHVIYTDIKHSCYDYNDAKNVVNHNIVALERLIITTGGESRKRNGNSPLL